MLDAVKRVIHAVVASISFCLNITSIIEQPLWVPKWLQSLISYLTYIVTAADYVLDVIFVARLRIEGHHCYCALLSIMLFFGLVSRSHTGYLARVAQPSFDRDSSGRSPRLCMLAMIELMLYLFEDTISIFIFTRVDKAHDPMDPISVATLCASVASLILTTFLFGFFFHEKIADEYIARFDWWVQIIEYVRRSSTWMTSFLPSSVLAYRHLYEAFVSLRTVAYSYFGFSALIWAWPVGFFSYLAIDRLYLEKPVEGFLSRATLVLYIISIMIAVYLWGFIDIVLDNMIHGRRVPVRDVPPPASLSLF